MISTSVESESGNAFIALARRAKLAPGPFLIACETVGFGAALAVYALIPARSSLALPFLGIGAFGLWGIIDHVLESPPRLKSRRRSLLRGFQLAIAMAGIACAAATGFLVAGWLMGTFVL